MNIRWRAFIGWISIALVIALVFTFIPVEPTITAQGFISLSLREASAEEPEMGELVGLRTLMSKTYYLGNHAYSLDASMGSVHYQNGNGTWQEIDNSWHEAQAPWDWEMIKDGYYTRVLEELTAGQVLKFESQGEYIAFQPMALEWTNDLDQIQQVSMPHDVAVNLSNEAIELLPSMLGNVSRVRWDNAYGVGRHFEWENTPGRLNKLLTLDSNLPVPPQYIIDGGNPVLRLNFIFDPSSSLDIYVNGALWDKSSKEQTFDTIEFRKDDEVLWGFMPAKYWDSNTNIGEGSGIGYTELRKVGNKLYVSVLVPCDWLDKALYPVYIDPALNLQVGASTDDCVRRLSPSFWDITYGTQFAGAYSASIYEYGGGMRFTNITIPQGATIDVAYLTFRATHSSNGANCNTRISAEDVDDAATFADDSGAFDTRWAARTTARVDWDNIAAWTADSDYNSPEIKTVIQEIVDRGSWASSNDLVIFWDDFEDRSTHATGVIATCNLRQGESYDGDTTHCSKLHIEYTAVEPDISVNPTSYDFGNVSESSTYNTTTGYFNLTNSSTMQTDQTISVTSGNWTGGINWTHSDTCTPGANTAGLKANRNETWGTNDTIVKYSSPNYIYENCPATTNYTFGLSLHTPVSFSDGQEKTNIVRITAVAG